MSEKEVYGVTYGKEPRNQVVTYKGIPCTARTCCTRLNRLEEENEELKHRIKDLIDNELEDRDIVCGAGKFRLEEWGKHRYHQFYKGDEELEDETVVIMLMELEKENKELKKQREELFIRERDTKNELREIKERNNRQAKQLDNLYYLIEKQDWKTLKGLIQEFQECEKQLQKEWGTYGDFE